MKKDIINYLNENGPSRASDIVDFLTNGNVTNDAARKRLSRIIAAKDVIAFTPPLLPKKENFLYLKEQRDEERFWKKFLDALRSTQSCYGIAIDGLIARGGIVPIEEFQTVSAAPTSLKKQILHNQLVQNLYSSGIIKTYPLDPCYLQIADDNLCVPMNMSFYRLKDLVEKSFLGAIKEWARNLGLASYDKIRIRGDEKKRCVGQFQWDLTGPSYFFPMRSFMGNSDGDIKPGFLVADIFSDELDEFAIRFFIRKLEMLSQSIKNIKLMPILVAEKFTNEAFRKGKEKGIIFATHESLFGKDVAIAVKTLLLTLNQLAADISVDKSKLLQLFEKLNAIEGRAGNLSGVVFELIAYYLAALEGAQVILGKKATDNKGNTADIDVFKIIGKNKCICIECKGISAKKSVSREDVEHWIKKISVIKGWLKTHQEYRNATASFEIWTTGTFSSDILEYLNAQQKQMPKTSICWKDGNDIYEIARGEKVIIDMLNQHFRKHPYAC